MNPNSTIGPIKPICANPNPTHKPTICDSRLRTINVHAECGSPLDIYYYSPWRAPGVRFHPPSPPSSLFAAGLVVSFYLLYWDLPI